MRRIAISVVVVLAFAAVWALAAGAGAWFLASPTLPRPMAGSERSPLPKDLIVAEAGSRTEDVAGGVLAQLGGTVGAPSDEDKPEVRGLEPVSGDPAATDGPQPIDTTALGALVERLKASKDTGLLKPEIPAEMTVYQTQRVKVVLARQEKAAALAAAPGADLKNASEIPIRDFVSVKLYGGSDFRVEPITADASIRSLKGGDLAEWEFDVTPITGGSHDLEIIVLLYDQPAFLPVAKFSQKVAVEVPFGSQLRLIWSGYGGDWIVNLLLAPLLGAIIAYFVKEWLTRRRPPAASGTSGTKPG
jgi:hypothetical protein